MSRRAPEGSGLRNGLNELASAHATKGQPGGGRLRMGPAKGTPQGFAAQAQRGQGQGQGYGPLNDRGYQAPEPVDPQVRADAIAAKLASAKAASGQDGDPNGTSNAASAGIGRYGDSTAPAARTTGGHRVPASMQGGK